MHVVNIFSKAFHPKTPAHCLWTDNTLTANLVICHNSSLDFCYSSSLAKLNQSQHFCCKFYHIWLNETQTLPYRKDVLSHILRVCFRSKFTAATGHHFMNKFQRKSFLQNMEEKLAQQQDSGVQQIVILFLLSLHCSITVRKSSNITFLEDRVEYK